MSSDCSKPAPRRVRLAEIVCSPGGFYSSPELSLALAPRAFVNARNLRVVVEADAAEEPTRCPGCLTGQATRDGGLCAVCKGPQAALDEIYATERALKSDITKALTANAPREEVDDAIRAGLVCGDCRGSGKYQPLMGPAEDCRACGGRGHSR